MTAAPRTPATTTVADRLDELPATGRHWKIVGLAGLGWAFDAMDVGIVSFALVALGRDWDLDRTTLGLVASIGFAGMFVGAAAAGRMADRYGRDLRALSRTRPDGTEQSIAEEMRRSGLARRYFGYKADWCAA